MSNINFSGLNGQALEVKVRDIPSIKEFKSVIPSHCFNSQTITSLAYLLQSTIIQLIVIAIGDIIAFCPPLIITDSQINDMFDIVEESLKKTMDELTKQRLLK